MAKQVEFYQWYIVDEVTGNRRLTRFAMDRETAVERYGNPEPDPRTRELRTVYEPGEAPPNARPPRGPG